MDEGSIHCELDVASKSSSEGLRFDLSEKGDQRDQTAPHLNLREQTLSHRPAPQLLRRGSVELWAG